MASWEPMLSSEPKKQALLDLVASNAATQAASKPHWRTLELPDQISAEAESWEYIPESELSFKWHKRRAVIAGEVPSQDVHAGATTRCRRPDMLVALKEVKQSQPMPAEDQKVTSSGTEKMRVKSSSFCKTLSVVRVLSACRRQT
jgi:hypothetical protein